MPAFARGGIVLASARTRLRGASSRPSTASRSAGRSTPTRAYGRGSSTPQHDGAAPRQDDPQSEVDAVLDLQQAYGNQAVVQLLAAGGHGSPPPVVPSRSSIGNRALADMLGRPGVQREAPKAGSSGAQGAPGAKARAAKPKGKPSAATVDSLIDLLNDFQDLAAAAVNRQGAGLESIRFGKDLNANHRYLLNHLRAVMIQGRSEDADERKQAAKSWPWISKKLQAAVGEATNLNFRGDVIAAVNDAIAQVGSRYFRARRQAADPEPETYESYRDVIRGINELTFAFERMGEAGEGIIREEVPKRKDIAVSQAVVEINKKQRDRLAAVRFGDHLTRQHRQALETLRAILITARTESAGSANRAWARWQTLQRTLDRMLQRTTVFAEVDLGTVRQSLATAGETLANHYRVVHAESIRAALKRERSEEEKQSDKEKEKVFGPGMAEHLREKRAIQDFRHALSVIERDLGPSPTRPDEWVLMRDGQPIRLRAEQGMAVREAARSQVKEYMASLVTAMVEAWLTYDSIKRGTGSTRRKVLGFIGGADDPGDQSEARASIIAFRDKVVYKLADEGKYVAALEAILSRKGDVERRARAVGDYDTDLDRGFKRLAIGASVVQVALVSLVPMAGAAAMAPTIVGGVVVAEGASALAVGTTAVAAGAAAPALVETGRQLASDEKMDYGKIANTAKTGGLIGFSAVAPVVTNKVAGFIAPGATGSTAVGANMAASSLMGGLQSKAGGGSFLEGAAGGGFGSLAGSVVNQVAPVANAPLTNMAMQGVAGGTVSYATGQDVLSGVVGGMAGSAGDRMLLNKAGGGGSAPPSPPPERTTQVGTGIQPRTPGPIGDGRIDPLGATIPGANVRPPAPPTIASPDALAATLPGSPRQNTLLGTGIEPRTPGPIGDAPIDPLGATIPGANVRPPAPPTVASPGALADTAQMPAARPGPGVDNTIPGTGVGDRRPAGPGGPESDGPAPVGGSSRSLDATGQGMSAPPDPAKMLGGQKTQVPRVHALTDDEVAAAIHDNPTAVHRSWDETWHEEMYRLDHGQGATVPKAYRHRGGIIVAPDYVLPPPREGAAGPPSGGFATGTRKSKFATLPGYGDRKPLMGSVVHIIDGNAEALALYTRLHQQGETVLGTSDAGAERAQWRADGGKGEPPLAWVRAGDGVVRFNFSKLPRPNLGGHSTEPAPKLPLPGDTGKAGSQQAPRGQPMVREWARLPEFEGKPPMFGPESRVVHVITDKAEAQRLWDRLVAERQLHILEYPESVGSLRWSDHGGTGPVPMAWITSDGVIRFTSEKFRPGSVVE